MKLPSLPRVAMPEFRGPRFKLPWTRHTNTDTLGTMATQTPAEAALGGPGSLPAEDDARILRRTRLRLMGVSGAITAAILLVLGLTAYGAVSNLVVGDSVSKLEDCAEYYAGPLIGSPPDSGTTLDRQWGTRYADVFVYISMSTPAKTVIDYTEGLPPGVPVQTAVAAATATGSDIREVTTAGGVPLRVYTLTGQTTVRGTTVQYFIQTAMDRTQEINLLSLLRSVLLVGGALALLLALLAGYFYAGRALVPIRASMSRREAALQRQREFAANASHELRTPLTVIGASVEDLKRNRRSRVEDVGEALTDIDAEVRHMTALVEDMLLLARTDSGVIQVEKVPVDLADIAVEAVSTLSPVANEKSVRLELDPLPVFVMGDQLRLRQLVTILTDNAVKHTRPNSTVRVHAHPDQNLAVLRVDDEGAGVRPEDMPRLFERFYRADNAPAGGTGLGLSIAKWIVEQHGGRIGAYNRPEGGATFWAAIPILAPAAVSEPFDQEPFDQEPFEPDAPEPPASASEPAQATPPATPPTSPATQAGTEQWGPPPAPPSPAAPPTPPETNLPEEQSGLGD